MVEVINYEKANKGKTIGYVDIKIPITKPTSIILRRIRHLESDGRKWLAIPNFTVESTVNGAPNNKFVRYYNFEIEEYNSKLLNSLSEKIAEFIQKNSLNNAQDNLFDDAQEVIPF